LAPENTLAAFRKGAEYGYRMFECDAKLSADDVVFLMHDATLHRTTNGHGIGGEQSWQQLSQLDAGSWHSRHFSGEPLPTLANLAHYCIRNRYLNQHLVLNLKQVRSWPDKQHFFGSMKKYRPCSPLFKWMH
jgi:glycerophosphoryl diester phosphodiesterase